MSNSLVTLFLHLLLERLAEIFLNYMNGVFIFMEAQNTGSGLVVLAKTKLLYQGTTIYCC